MRFLPQLAHTRKARAIAGFACLLLCIAPLAAAISTTSPAPKCDRMSAHGMQLGGHDCCPREMARQMSEATHRECCYMDQEPTPAVPRETGTPAGKVQQDSRGTRFMAAALNIPSSLRTSRQESVEPYARPVFEAKADLRI